MWENDAMENQNIIPAVIKTLGTISVSGKENMSKLLGCIQALETTLEQPLKSPTDKEE